MIFMQSTATSDSEIDYPDYVERPRASHGLSATHLRHHRKQGRRAQREDDDSSGFSSSDYGDVQTRSFVYGRTPQQRTPVSKMGSRQIGAATQRVEDSLQQINGDLSRILSLLNSRSALPFHGSFVSQSQPELGKQLDHHPLHGHLGPAEGHVQSNYGTSMVHPG